MSPDTKTQPHSDRQSSHLRRGALARRRAALRPFAEGPGIAPILADAVRTARLRQVQRRVGFARRAAGFWADQLDRTRNGLQALEQDLADETGDPPVETTDDGTDYDTTDVGSVDPGTDYDTTGIGDTSAGTEGAPPPPPPVAQPAPPATEVVVETADHRVLYDVFDDLSNEDFTDDFYPRVDAVSAALRVRSQPDIDRTSMHSLFDRYLHDRFASGQISPPPRWPDAGEAAVTGKAKKVTTDVLDEAFKTIGSSDMTSDGQYPLVSEVQARVSDEYERPTKEQIHKAWDRRQR